jgi:RHS repeat-associated protein
LTLRRAKVPYLRLYDTYDGDEKRVQKSGGKIYWYGLGSDPLDETDLTGSTTNTSFNEYILFGGKRIARRDYSNNVNYYFADHLGAARIVANSSGSVLDDSDFYPFEGERVVTSSSGSNYKFTGKERDSESGLDNFGARYYSSSAGRFMTPDWSNALQPVPYADLKNPQSLNLYGYVDDNPLSRSDEDGHEPCTVDGEKHGSIWCWFHEHHLFGVETAAERKADQVNDARKFITANGFDLIKVNGHWQPSSSSSDNDIASWWKDYNDAYREGLNNGLSATGAFGLMGEALEASGWRTLR